MIEPVFNLSTKRIVDYFLAKPSSASGIFGYPGTGKLFTAKYIAANILIAPDIDTYPYYQHVKNDKQITIDQIREIKKFLTLIVPSNKPFNRIVIIEDLHNSSLEAQNALLKILEEPPERAMIIVTAASKADLLPTIISRLTAIELKNISMSQAVNFFENKFEREIIEKAYKMSGGKIGSVCRMLYAGGQSNVQKNLDFAKKILAVPKYQRFSFFDELSSSSELSLAGLIDSLIIIFKHQLGGGGSKRNLSRLRMLVSAQASLKYNANQKLVYTYIIHSL